MKKKMTIAAILLAGCLALQAQTVHNQVSEKWGTTLPSGKERVGRLEKKEIKALRGQPSHYFSSLRDGLKRASVQAAAKHELVRLKQGKTLRRAVKSGRLYADPIPSRADNLLPLEAPAATHTLYQTFEDYNGVDWDWLPDGWSEENKQNTPSHAGPDAQGRYYNFTWHVDSLFASAGKYGANVMVSAPVYLESGDTIPENSQDEWLFLPALTLGNDDNLYFYLAYNPAYLLIDIDKSNAETMDFTSENNRIEVLISTDNGENWTMEWSVRDDALAYPKDELQVIFDSLSFPWKFFKVNLSKYKNQSVKTAFRFTSNGYGTSAFLDEIRVGTPNPHAVYTRPDGYFFFTFTQNYQFYGDGANALLGAAYEPAKWYNFRNVDSETFKWTFSDPDDLQKHIDITDPDPMITYPYTEFDAPVLTAYASNPDYNSSYIWCDGKGWAVAGGNSYTGYAGNYNVWNEPTLETLENSEGYLFGTGSDEFYAPQKLIGLGNAFDKPPRKYVFDTLMIRAANVVADADAELKLIIHRIVDGQMADTIAVSTVYGSDAVFINDNPEGVRYYNIPFTFKRENPVSGWEEPTYLEIEDAILVEFTGFASSKVQSLGVLHQNVFHTGNENNAYLFFSGQEGEKSFKSLASYRLYTSFLFDMNVTYPFLRSNNGVYQYAAPNEGGNVDFDIHSFWHPDLWEYTYPDNWTFTGDVPSDWVTIGEYIGDPEASIATLPVSVSALPDGISGRSADITIQSPGCSLILQFKQGDADYGTTSVAAVKTATTSAVCVGNRFLLSYPEGMKQVAIYTVAGQKTGSWRLPAGGKFSVPVAGWGKGVYILRFSGDRTEAVKVVKDR
ncbi:MAG: choice-of-anchor J domain-containing protein [Dysgonamonadaceae bacterium]|jgi:hypothetical protein|nr:choice-of-anchor J domain-containing protein [Dysgonamonadaceae bacterium]